MKHKHLYYGPKEFGWRIERCIDCSKPKPKGGRMARTKTGANYVVKDGDTVVADFPTRQAARICKRTLDYQKTLANQLRPTPSTVRVYTSAGFYIH